MLLMIKTLQYARFFLDNPSLYAIVVGVTIGLAGPDGAGRKAGFLPFIARLSFPRPPGVYTDYYASHCALQFHHRMSVFLRDNRRESFISEKILPRIAQRGPPQPKNRHFDRMNRIYRIRTFVILCSRWGWRRAGSVLVFPFLNPVNPVHPVKTRFSVLSGLRGRKSSWNCVILRFSGTDDTDFFEQKRTKETKEEFFFVAFVCFCANSVSRAARMGNSESVKSVESVVALLWLRRAAPGLLCLFAENQLKCLTMNTLRLQRGFFNQA